MSVADEVDEVLDEVLPWSGEVILDRVEEYVARFVAHPSEASRVAHALWIAHTWFMAQWESTPRLAFLSPEPGSGKSRALEVTEPLVPRPVHAVNTTPAYLFRKVSDPAGAPTILYDEIDTVFGPKAKDNEDVRGMLNAGHRRGATAGRCIMRGKVVETEELEAYCAVALAGLDDLPDTIATRSVIVRMRRRGPGERVEPYRHRVNGPQAAPIAAQLAAWSNAEQEMVTWPEMPDGIEDRNADVWEPLLAVADLAGGAWPERARRAAVTLVTDKSGDRPTLGVQLLDDLRSAFGSRAAMSTDAVLTTLVGMEESPWSDLRGRPLDPRGLAQRLRPYDITPRTVRLPDGTTAKGYRADDLADAWARYLPGTSLDSTRPVELVPASAVTTVTTSHPQVIRDGMSEVTDMSQDDRCRVCLIAGLWHPESKRRGVCERCHRAEQHTIT